jgi:hypothetical protein
MKCDEDYGCGKETASLFSVTVDDASNPDADLDGLVDIKVCRDCAATGNWVDEE